MRVAFIMQRAAKIASNRETRFVSVIKSDYAKRENKCRFRRPGCLPWRSVAVLRRLFQGNPVLLALNTPRRIISGVF